MKQENKMKVNAEVRTKTHAKFKSRCADIRMPMGEVLDQLMELYLAGKVKL